MSLFLPVSIVSVVKDNQYSENIDKAINWLKDGYNFTIGLIREDHMGSSNPDRINNYWLFSDNFLSYMVLSKYDKTHADTILQTIHLYNFSQNYKHSAYAPGYKIHMPPYGANQTRGYPPGWLLVNNITGSEIWHETYLNYTTRISNSDHYVDWLFPKALTYHWQGNDVKAREIYEKAICNYWNDTGFTDVIEYEAFTTYKIGAALYTGLLLYPDDEQIPEDLSSKFIYWKQLIWKLQRDDGGIPTHYHANKSTIGHNPNTETVCFSLLYTIVQDILVKTIELPNIPYMYLISNLIVLILILMEYYISKQQKNQKYLK